jgi:flavin-dependent dehydrogenase
LRIAIVGTGVAGSYLLNRIPPGHHVEAFEMREEDKWWAVCAWGTSAPFISDLVKMAGLNFEDYILHRGKRMMVDPGNGKTFDIKLRGLVCFDKTRLFRDMKKGKTVHYGAQIKDADDLKEFDMIIDATGFHRSLMPKLKKDASIPCFEVEVEGKFPWDDFYIKPYPTLSGYFWFFPLGEGRGHVGAGDFKSQYRGEIEAMIKKYDWKVVRRIGRPVRILPPAYCQPFYSGKVVGVGESIGTVYPLLGEGIIPSMQCVNLFVEHMNDLEAYSEAILKHYDVYAKVYRFIDAKMGGNFSWLRKFPELWSIYWHMRTNERRYGLETHLGDILKVVSV